MRNYRLFLVSLLVIVTLCMGCSNGITKKSDNNVTSQSDNNARISPEKELNSLGNIYVNNKFNFSVEYPVKWNIKEEEYYEATIERNASPDGGIYIFVESKPDETIYVYGQLGHGDIDAPYFQRESFATNSGMKGSLLSNEIDGKKIIYLNFNDFYIRASLHISIECFNQNKEQIMDILKSIKPI